MVFFHNVGVGCSYFHSYFSAKEEHVVRGKIIEYHPVLLDVAPMERIGGWSLEGEDPSLYTQDQLWKGGRRDWPEIPLPTATAPAGGARPKTTSASAPDDDDEEDSQPRGPLHPTDPQIQDLLKIHHSMVKLLKSMGVDACKDYHHSRMEVILDSIQSTDLECKVCGKVYKKASKMKRHFRKRHLGVTKFQCDVCVKYYTDAGSLKTHKASHNASKNPHGCKKCTKTFPPKAFWGSMCQSMTQKENLSVILKRMDAPRSLNGRRAKLNTCPSMSTIWIGLKSHPFSVTLKSAQRGIGIKGLSCTTTGRNLPTSRTNNLCGYRQKECGNV